ncbi:QueT transporter family protein [Lachnoclostridium sp. An169]|mgnify:CR=1 FL=1|uniref:QueT transporter family protein n=1 Tax=Lachnoclostridium sp. An169 TaxID=1965569 RepID=UPI00194E5A83|nr:QueT transporter family protein [Lachnoclostridium sp. An169]HJA68158.1 QueT transporter family protein [Candidatus Mediterraneibacter cottocaccae]
MDNSVESMSRVQKMTVSAMVMALYIVILALTQSFSFGAYQIRIATALYALAYLFPFLVLPLGLANFISNLLFGGFGIVDMLGGCIVGMTAAACIVLIRKMKWNRVFIAVPIVLVPGLGVATYLSYFLAMPYPLMALNLCIGQLLPSVCGVALVKVLERVLYPHRAVRTEEQKS